MQKVIPVGDAGSLSIGESGGKAYVAVSISKGAGGGSMEGVVSGSLSASVTFDAQHLIDMGLELLKAKYPALSAIVDGAKAAIDAEMAKV